MNNDRRKLRAQVKSRWYYIFWGAATVSVFAGQIHVGNGFNRMSETLEKVFERPVMIEVPYPRDGVIY